jgi:hypothetical protein
MTKQQWEWIAVARMLARKRNSTLGLEQILDGLLSEADQAMVNAFTGGFRVAQTRLAIDRVLPEPLAAAALESCQVVALAVLVREQLFPGQFSAIYRPFATVLPGPDYQLPPAVDRQIAAFLERLPSLTGEIEAEVATVAKALSEPSPTPPAATPAVAPGAGSAPPTPLVVLTSPDAPSLYAAAWKAAIATANQSGRTHAFRAAQDGAEQKAPHDGSGIVGCAGVAAGGIFMRDVMPIEQVLLLYEPFAAAFPYESLQ